MLFNPPKLMCVFTGQPLCRLRQKKAFTKEKSSTLIGMVWDINVTDVTSREKALLRSTFYVVVGFISHGQQAHAKFKEEIWRLTLTAREASSLVHIFIVCPIFVMRLPCSPTVYRVIVNVTLE